MLQVISVSRKDRAEQTRDALGKMGYKAYIKPARVEGKTVYRVYVGPKFERARLDAIKAEVDREFGVNSMVRRYLP
nr:SPOR domain-containing protein [Parahaliea mediterranea]